MLEVGFVQIRPLLEHDYSEAVARELARHHATCRTTADDREVDLVRRRIADRRRLPNAARHARLPGRSRAMISGRS